MSTNKKLWLGLAALALVAFAMPAKAATSQAIDIKVSITATKSLAVNTTYYDYGALAVSVSSVSSNIDVTNDSVGLVESYSLQGQNAASTGGGTPWTLAASPNNDTYALAAQFSDAQPNNVDGSWGSDDLTTSVINCTATVLGNGTAGESGASVASSAVRKLWFRLKTPTSVSDTTQHNATLTLAVQ